MIYGHNQRTVAHIEPRMPAEARDREMAAARERARCDQCRDVPDAVLASIVTALRTAARAGRPR